MLARLDIAAALLAAAVALPLATLGPPGGDEPAHLYRTELVRDGVVLWDNFWFAGHYPLASYSALYYFPAAVLGNVPLALAAAVAAAALFAGVAEHEWGAAARWPSAAFAVLAAGPIFTGTYPYAVGLVALLATLRALQLRRRWIAALCAVLTLGFSPLAFLFLCLALLAAALTRGVGRRTGLVVGLAVAGAGAANAAAFALFAHDATYPFFRTFELGLVLLAAILGIALSLRNRRAHVLAAFLALWALAAVLAYFIPTPLGENVTRLRGLLLPLMLLAAVVVSFRPLWLVVPALTGALAYSLVPYLVVIPFRGDGRPANEAFWAPALAFLRGHRSPDYRIEVVPTGDHWESYWLPRAGFPLARGWYRQLDYTQNRLFYEDELGPARYRAWLRRLGVRYVLLPRTQLGRSGEEREAELLLSGRAGLHAVAAAPGWLIWEVPDAVSMLPGGELTHFGHDEIAGRVPAPGTYRLAVRYMPYWRLDSGALCTAEAPDGMTELRFSRRGPFRLEAALTARGSTTCPNPSTG